MIELKKLNNKLENGFSEEIQKLRSFYFKEVKNEDGEGEEKREVKGKKREKRS